MHSSPATRPSRYEAQADAVNLIFSAKTQANPESSVGLMSMGGKGPEVLVTLTTDFGKVLDGLHRTKIRGNTHLATGIQVAGVSALAWTVAFVLYGVLSLLLLARPEAPSKQVPTPAHHRLHLLSDRRGPEDSCEAGKQNEEI